MGTRERPTSIERKILELKEKQEIARLGGGVECIEKQHAKGKLTARERVNLLLDQNSFEELDMFRTSTTSQVGLGDGEVFGDGIITGYGSIFGRLVFVYSFDLTVYGGSLSQVVAEKVVKVMDLAAKVGAPVMGINDSGRARIQEWVDALSGYTDISLRNALYSGVIPQISAVVGPAAGGAVYSPALTDFIFMVRRTSFMFLTGPKVIKQVTHEEVSADELGGADVHASKCGITHFTFDGEHRLFEGIRTPLRYLPQNNMEEPVVVPNDDPADRLNQELNYIVSNSPNKPYDMKTVITTALDNQEFLEVQELFAPNVIIGFGRLNGRAVGVVGNQPKHLAGVLDCKASVKAARFVRFCDCFNIPGITFEDVPGFMPGVAQEYNGIISHGAKLLYAYAEDTVPKITVITRKAYGGAFCVMNSKHLGGDIIYAWPTAEIAVMGPEGQTRSSTPRRFRKQRIPREN